MTSPGGGVRIPVTAAADGFTAQLRDAVIDALREVQIDLDAHPLDIKIDIDTTAAITAARTALSEAGLNVTANLDIDSATAITAAETALANAGLNITANLDIDTAAAITAAETALAAANLTANAKVDLDLNVTAEQQAALQEIRGLTDKTVRVKVDLDMSEAEASRLRDLGPTLRSIRTLTDKNIRVKFDLDMSEAEAARLKDLGPTLRSIRTLTDKNIRVKVNLDMTDAELARLKDLGPALRNIRTLTDKNVRVKVHLDMSEAEAARLKDLGPTLRSISRLTDKDIKVKIDIQADEARLRAIAALLREIRSRNVNVNVNTDADRAASSFGRLGGSLSGAIAKIAGGAAAIAAIGGAAGAAAGAVGGLVIGLAAMGPAAVAVAGTAAVALSGIKDAFSAAAAAAQAGPAEAASSAKAVAAAQSGLQSALDGATSAQQSYTDATKTAEQANKDVADSYRLAGEDLEDLQFKLRGSVISQKEAELSLAEAQAEFNKVQFDPSRREQALVRLQRAQLTYDKSLADGRDVAEEAADAEAKGIENSDRVVSAKDAAAKADQRVQDAARQSAAAQRAVAQAQAAVAEAQSAGTPTADAYAKAMAKLAPAAQEFVLAARELGPEWENVRKSVQQTAFEGLGATLTNIAGQVLPVLQTGMGAVAGQMNAAAKDFLNFTASAQGLEGLRSTFAGTASLLEGMRSGTGGFATGIIDLVRTAEPAMFGLGQAFANIGGEIGKAFTAASQSGELGSMFEGLTQALTGAGPLLGSLVSSLITLGDRVLPSLQPLFVSLGDALVTIAPALGDLGAVFADSLTAIMPSLSAFIRDLAEGLRPVLPVIANLLGAVFDALRPLIGPLSQIAVVVGTALADAVRALAPSIGPLGQAFADLVTAVAPLIPLFAESLSAVLQAIAPALSQIAVALAPVIAQFATQMQPVIAQIAPVLAEVATTLGVAMADAIRQIAPVLPDLVTSFSNLLLAILPILPELARMAAELLPPLVNVLVQITPQVIKLIDALTWLVQNVIIPYVIPYVQLMVDGIAQGLEVVGSAIETMRDVASTVKDFLVDTVFPALGRGIDMVQGWFETGVDAISQKWNELKEAAAVPIRYVVNTVWNDGLRKAWNSVAGFLPGVGELEPVTLGFRSGGAVRGAGTATSDSIPAWLSDNEHVVTAAEVLAAGGQNIWYAIRDMIARGVPFTWDGGKVIQDLGRDNLDTYGAAVRTKGIGNVSPEGLFDSLVPRFREGGAVLPWMHQLKGGHDFARAQDGRAYQWAGPRFVGDSFDCSGFMASIIAAILGGNPWQRYWATPTFAGYPQVGAQGLVKNLTEGVGMLVGITDNPGGPGGGHTAGELRGIPELGIPSARVESGGALGDVHYGRGTAVNSFASLYGLPIGANGFFQPSTGGSVGPTPADQGGFVQSQINRVFREITDPIKGEIEARVGAPPPAWRKIPPEFLTTVQDKSVQHLAGLVGGLGDLLPGAWQKAQDLAGRAFHALTPFDTGGIASGTGIMAKNTIEPERVLSPEQTRLFEALVAALQSISGSSGPATTSVVDAISSSLSGVVSDVLKAVIPEVSKQAPDNGPVDTSFLEDKQQAQFDAQGQLISDTATLALRTQSTTEKALTEQFEQVRAQLTDVADKLTEGVLGPVVSSAMSSALGVVEDAISASTKSITAAQDKTTTAVENIPTGGAGVPAFGAPGSAFDFGDALSKAVVSISNTASAALIKIGQDIANAALEQRKSTTDQSRGLLGSEGLSGGPLIDTIIRLTGVEIEVRDLMSTLAKDMREFRGEEFKAFDETGALISDTTSLVERTASSTDLVVAEQNRINRALLASVLRYLMVDVVIPVLTAILTALITVATTAIGAYIGTLIAGPVGTAVGAAVGAAVGVALSAAAAVLLAGVGLGAGAAIDSIDQFDEGGLAPGTGLMAKNTIAPERVLSPRQTLSFERLVEVLDRGAVPTHRTVQVGSINVHGADPAQRTNDRLLALLNI